ncbi:PA2169 family four-helix-bundle protein [Verrucomicrobium sp. BvORR034]|jgi:uncharacterized protein (TIGR02284 family)|uniref:ferritin-like domain-containing protein n=1 Tax=Verrucomicrobium sp. BvORR034 TaxID=1396418 RepID=UPI00067986BF|nr:PA2169 family four-helix-bundle protein [Verrucomicrobium sp. BvORR034]
MNSNQDIKPIEDILSLLHNLIGVSRDGEEGFKQAAEHARAEKLKQVFANYSHQRHDFVTQLQELERRFGETDVDEKGSATGGLHRAWIGLRTALTSNDDQALLEEAERGEDAAKAAFEDAQRDFAELPVDVRSAIAAQSAQVRQAHDEVKKLRDSGLYKLPQAS